jgi:HSP20 family protein
MTLLRLQPFSEFIPLHREMDRLLGNLVDRSELPFASRFVPAAELEVLPDRYQLNLELPGIDPDNIEIKATIDSISISGERTTETETETVNTKRSEFRYGKFYRTIDLPEEIQPEAVAAKYDRGVLHLSIPKTQVEKNKVVDIKVAA